MNAEENPSEYLLLFRSTIWDKNLSPAEMQRIMAETMAWFERLRRQGKLKAAQPLFEEGKIVSGKQGRSVADGPFAESKEAVGGYLLLLTNTLEEAVEIAQGWPLLECGASVEVRPVAPQCPGFLQLQEQLAHATA